jgi:hypothetical protein
MKKNNANVMNKVKKWVIRLFTGSVCRWIMENTQLIQSVIDIIMNFII